MSTNYYFRTKNLDFVNKYFPNEYEVEKKTVTRYAFGYPYDKEITYYEIHIGKRSCGWKPLFEYHKNAYTSVEEMLMFAKKHKLKIYDEYNSNLTLEGLKHELVAWGDIPKEDRRKFRLHRNGELERVDNDAVGDNIVSEPINHLTYDRLTDSMFKSEYKVDKDGYEFLVGSFC